MLDTTFNPPIPLSLKLGDANLDGFPDIITITGSGNDRVPSLVFSVPCAKNAAGCSADGTGRRGWRLATGGAKPLKTVKDARAVSFVDLDEDVRLPTRLLFLQTNRVMIIGHPGYNGTEDGSGWTWSYTFCPE